LTIWRATLELIRQRPLLGHGADSLGQIFPRVYPPELVYYQGRDQFVDRAHNLFLDWTVTAGIPGFLAICLVLSAFIVIMVQGIKSEDRPGGDGQKRLLLIGLLAGVAGNWVNNLVSFDVTATATASWLLMGMGVGLAASQRPRPPESARGTDGNGAISVWRWALVGLLWLGIAAAIWQANARPLLADVADRRAQQAGQEGAWTQAVAAGQRAVALWPKEPAHHLRLSDVYWGLAQTDPAAARSWLIQAEGSLRAAQKLRPAEFTIWLNAARFYTGIAQQLGPEGADLIDGAYGRAAELAPNHAIVYTAWGRTHLARGDPSAAIPLLGQALRLDASSGEAFSTLVAALGQLVPHGPGTPH
jgi:hypothetical protein